MTKDVLAEGKRKVLEALEPKNRKSDGDRLMSFSSLLEKTGLSKSVLSNHIKDLQKRGEIERDIDTRKYYLTEQGKKTTVKQRILTMVIKYFLEKPNKTKVDLTMDDSTNSGKSSSLELKTFSKFLGASHQYLTDKFSEEIPEELPENLTVKIKKTDQKIEINLGN